MTICLVLDCKQIDRERNLCQVNPDNLKLNARGNCTNYVRDMKYLREQWKYERPE